MHGQSQDGVLSNSVSDSVNDVVSDVPASTIPHPLNCDETNLKVTELPDDVQASQVIVVDFDSTAECSPEEFDIRVMFLNDSVGMFLCIPMKVNGTTISAVVDCCADYCH